MRHTVFAAIAAVALVGCSPDRPKLPSLPEAFAALPLPPSAEFLQRSGSSDALMFTFRSPWQADSVAGYYKWLFERDTMYHVVNSTTGASGEHAYYIEYERRPIWLRIRPEAGNEGSIVELTGAVVARPDSAKADTARDPNDHRPTYVPAKPMTPRPQPPKH